MGVSLSLSVISGEEVKGTFEGIAGLWHRASELSSSGEPAQRLAEQHQTEQINSGPKIKFLI
jgi:hypothetical protein